MKLRLALLCMSFFIMIPFVSYANQDVRSLSTVPLPEVVSYFKERCGIDVVVPKWLLGNRLPMPAATHGCDIELGDLFSEYNYVAMMSRGKILRIVVSSLTSGTGNQAANFPAELVEYRNDVDSIPEFYRGIGQDSVWPIQLAKGQLSAMAPGETLVLSLPRGRYQVVLDQRVERPDHELTWLGHFTDRGLDYPVTLTLGPNGSVGRIESPEGVFQIEWIDHGLWMIDLAAAGLLPQSG